MSDGSHYSGGDVATAAAFTGAVCGFFAGLFFYHIGHADGVSAVREEAVRANAAAWSADKDGRPVILWRNVQPTIVLEPTHEADHRPQR